MYHRNNYMVIILLVWFNSHVDAAFFHPSWTRRNLVKASGPVKTRPRLPVPTRTVPLFSKNNKDDKNNDNEKIPGKNEGDMPFLTIAIPLVTLVAFWPLLSLLRDTNDPTSGFDVDMFMALKGILDATNDESNLPDDFLELPPLSPAERLVDAIFGPPLSP